MSIKHDLKMLLQPYFIVNLMFTFAYIVCKMWTPLCHFVFVNQECELNMRESEILFFLLVVVMMRARKTGSMTMLSYLSNSFIYAKVANNVLWYLTDLKYGLTFTIVCILQSVFIPEPAYKGPDKVVYFRANGLEEELERDKKSVWLVCFYALWSPSCVTFAPYYAKLSAEYGLDNLKFGKIDIGRYPDVARKFYINDTSLSKQLPTVIMFRNGKEVLRRPTADSRGKLVQFFFSEDNFKAAFDLNNLYTDCKDSLNKISANQVVHVNSTTGGAHVKSE